MLREIVEGKSEWVTSYPGKMYPSIQNTFKIVGNNPYWILISKEEGGKFSIGGGPTGFYSPSKIVKTPEGADAKKLMVIFNKEFKTMNKRMLTEIPSISLKDVQRLLNA